MQVLLPLTLSMRNLSTSAIGNLYGEENMLLKGQRY